MKLYFTVTPTHHLKMLVASWKH